MRWIARDHGCDDPRPLAVTGGAPGEVGGTGCFPRSIRSANTSTARIDSIAGRVDDDGDRAAGIVEGTWIDRVVYIECHPWGAPQGAPRSDDIVFLDGVDIYSYSWTPNTEWPVRSRQNIPAIHRETANDEVYSEFYLVHEGATGVPS